MAAQHSRMRLLCVSVCVRAQIQLGGANSALCHFLSLGGLEFLLDCGLPASISTTSTATTAGASASDGSALRIRLPALHAVDVASLDVLLLSNHHSMLALPFVTEQLGFQVTTQHYTLVYS